MNVQELKRAAAGRWLEILTTLGGIDAELLDGQHHACPKCGGMDRFRAMDLAAGAPFCNQCFAKGNGDGLAALGWLQGWDFRTTLQNLAGYLGIENGRARDNGKAGPIVATYDYRDQAGELVFQVCRREPGAKGKDFQQRRPKEGSGWPSPSSRS